MDGVDGVGGGITDCGADNEDADADDDGERWICFRWSLIVVLIMKMLIADADDDGERWICFRW